MANEAMRDNWATGAEGWVHNERIFDAVLAPFTASILGAADLGAARRVLDVGCGAGTLLAAAVEPADAGPAGYFEDGPVFSGNPRKLKAGVHVPAACYKILVEEENGQP